MLKEKAAAYGLKALQQPRLWLSLFSTMVLSGRPIHKIIEVAGIGPMQVVLPDRISIRLLLDNKFDPNMHRFLTQVIKPGGTFIDVGAHIGTETLLASRLVGKNGSVYAYEPNPEIFNVLQYNSSLTPERKANIHPARMAVSNCEGSIEITDLGIELSAWNSVSDVRPFTPLFRRIPNNPIKINCQATTLNKELTNINPSQLVIKIDAEGHEFAILKGATSVISKFAPTIIFEGGFDDLRPNGQSTADCLRLISSLNQQYQYYSLSNPIQVYNPNLGENNIIASTDRLM